MSCPDLTYASPEVMRRHIERCGPNCEYRPVPDDPAPAPPVGEPQMSVHSRPSVGVVHRAVRNYVANELKLGRDAVVELIRPMVAAAFHQLLSGSWEYTSGGWQPVRGGGWLMRVIRDQITLQVRDVVERVVREELRSLTRITVEISVPGQATTTKED